MGLAQPSQWCLHIIKKNGDRDERLARDGIFFMPPTAQIGVRPITAQWLLDMGIDAEVTIIPSIIRSWTYPYPGNIAPPHIVEIDDFPPTGSYDSGIHTDGTPVCPNLAELIIQCLTEHGYTVSEELLAQLPQLREMLSQDR